MAHRDKQLEQQEKHEKRIASMLEKSKGIWFSDRWVKVFVHILSLIHNYCNYLCKILLTKDLGARIEPLYVI